MACLKRWMFPGLAGVTLLLATSAMAGCGVDTAIESCWNSTWGIKPEPKPRFHYTGPNRKKETKPWYASPN